MTDSKSAEEKPKNEVAKRVVTPKRKYFFPEEGVTVEAEDSVEAATKLKKSKQVKEGDV